MDNIIKVTIKNSYGKDLIYPITFKKELKTLTGKKTLSIKDLNSLKIMGFTIEQVLTPALPF